MKLLGLTGGVGMGKSACADLMRARRLPVIDTDDLAREVVQKGQPALVEIQSEFGREFIAPDGSLDRRRLADRVFADEKARLALEGIVHPKIRALWRDFAARQAAAGAGLVVVVIPLLFETHAEQELDLTLCVACSPATQTKRLLSRGWSAEHIAQRNRAQLAVDIKMQRANFVIWSEGTIEVHEAQLQRILGHIR